MQTPISNVPVRPFASTERVHSLSPRYAVQIRQNWGVGDNFENSTHQFIDIDCALNKVRECMLLGISEITIDRVSVTPANAA